MTIFWFIWAAFSAYAFLLAPADSPDTLSLIVQLSTGQWTGINPAIVALFNLMGIWPMIYAAVMLFERSTNKFQPGLFCAASFGVGAFAILPYLALRQPDPNVSITPKPLLKLLDSRWLAIGLAIASTVLLAYGLSQGQWPEFWQQWQQNRFIHVMSLDFLMLSALFPIFAKNDALTRKAPAGLWKICFIPLLGALTYLCLRPPLILKELPIAN
jgi:hypothetical protein